MSNLQKSKLVDLIDKFNDTPWYLDDIFTIDTPQFSKHIPGVSVEQSKYFGQGNFFLGFKYI